jgi:hypothetical protein
MREEHFNVMMEGRSYDVKLSSPLLGHFLVMGDNLCQRNPPIHMDIKYDGYRKSYQKSIPTRRKDQDICCEGEQESTMSTAKIILSGNHFLELFCERGSVSVYKHTFVSLIILTTLIVAGIFAKCQYQTLDWQDGSYHTNPIYDFSILQKVVISTVTANI